MTTPGPISTRYESVGPLERGTTCEVGLSRMVADGGFVKLVVVKRLIRDHAVDPQAVARFFDEARLATRLTHANIVSTFDVAHDADGAFIASEWLEGLRFDRVIGASERLPVPVALAMVSEVLAALAHAHELRDHAQQALGIVHGAVAPKNVFVLFSGRAKLGKFGHARARDVISQTRSGPPPAEVRYLAPERTRGISDARSDLFSVGVILWEALSGKPFWGERSDVEILVELRRGFAPPTLREHAPEVSEALADICARATAPDPGERFGSAREMLEALEKVVEEEGLACRPRDVARYLEGAFADERRELRARLDQLLGAAASELPTLPPPSRAAVVPPVDEPDPGEEEVVRPAELAKRGATVLIAIAVVGALGLAAVVLGFMRKGDGGPRGAAAALTTPTAPSSATPPREASAPAEIVLDLRASPAEAEIRLDGELVPNPYHARRLRDGALHALAVSAGAGFTPIRRNISFSADARLDVELASSSAPRVARGGRSGPRSPTSTKNHPAESPAATSAPTAFDEQKLEAPGPKRQPTASLDPDDPWKK